MCTCQGQSHLSLILSTSLIATLKADWKSKLLFLVENKYRPTKSMLEYF